MVDPNDNHSTKWSKLTSDWFGLAYRLLDCVLLFGVITFQNCWISYYITSFNGHNNGWYFLFLVDFVMVFLFMSGAINAIHYYRKLHVFKRNQKSLSSSSERIANNFEINNKIFNIRVPQWTGALPLVWICWLLYVIVMSTKIFVLHLQDIAIQLYVSQSGGQVCIYLLSNIFKKLIQIIIKEPNSVGTTPYYSALFGSHDCCIPSLD